MIDALGMFKYKVAEIIRNKLFHFKNTDLLVIPLPEKVQGMGLEDAEFISDGHGRMNAYLNVKDMKLK